MVAAASHPLFFADVGSSGIRATLRRTATAVELPFRQISPVQYPVSTLSPSISCLKFRRSLYHLALRRHLNFSPYKRNYSEMGKSCEVEAHVDANGVAGSVRSPELVDFEYAELGLSYHKLPEEVGRVRTRQHVNPLSSTFLEPAAVPDWNTIFKDPTLPLAVDIGCGSGRFLLWLAKRNTDSRNYLGLEIRKKLVERANGWVKELTLSNIYFMVANATVSFQQLLFSYPGPLTMVFILCPDPHFKKRHHKRRVVQKALVESIVNNLASGGQVLVQSDVFEVALDMRNQFDDLPNLQHVDVIESASVPSDEDRWLLRNPMGIRTEREIHAELEGAKIYRRMYVKIP